MFGLVHWKACVIKDDLGSSAFGDQLKFNNRVDVRRPARRAPCLNNPLFRLQFKLPSGNVTTEKVDRPSLLPADLRRLGYQIQPFRRCTEQLYLLELPWIR